MATIINKTDTIGTVDETQHMVQTHSSKLDEMHKDVDLYKKTNNYRVDQLIDRIEYIHLMQNKRYKEQQTIANSRALLINEKIDNVFKKYKISLVINFILIIVLSFMTITFGIIGYQFSENYNDLYDKYIYLNQKFMSLEDSINKLPTKNEITVTTEPDDIMSGEEPIEEEVISQSINYKDITKPSNLTAGQLNSIIDQRLVDVNLSVTKFSGIGEALVKMENESNVNALFCLAVGSLESGHGTSNAAVNKNNLFGLIGKNGIMSFDSVDECISYWGNLIRKSYIDTGRDTVSKIQKKYCPDSSSWTNNVNTLIEIYSDYIKS